MGAPREATATRSQRDELEQLQEALRDVRQQREALPGENAQLISQLARLEEEVRALEQERDKVRAEWNKPVASLPARLETPFYATPSRRTLYGRLRSAMRSALDPLRFYLFLSLYIRFFLGNTIQAGRLRVALTLACIVLWFVMFSVFQDHEDDDERQAWSFDDEGFFPIVGAKGGKVLYSEVRRVEVIQGWLQRRFGFGSVRVTWAPGTATSLGKAKEEGMRRIDIDLLDAPHRLAEWLLARSREAGGKKTEGPHVG